MLLDIGSVLGGIGLAVVGFVVVILVCVVILRLLAAILPSYEDRTPAGATDATPDPDASAQPDPESAAITPSSVDEPNPTAPEGNQPD